MRKGVFPLSLVLGLVIVTVSHGQKQFVPDLPAAAFRNSTSHKSSRSTNVTETTDITNKAKSSASEEKPTSSPFRFDLTRINEQIVSQFDRAWSLVKAGTIDTESLVLIFRKPDKSYVAAEARYTNEYRKLTFAWQPNAIAIVHTHPNAAPCKPTEEDKKIADKFGVPIFTLTNRGMYMYDPATKSVATVHKDMDWLNPAKWTRDQIIALADK